MKQNKIGFIGFGNMASILVEGALHSKFISKNLVYFNRRDTQKAAENSEELGIQFDSLEMVIKQSDYLFLAIKPQQFPDLAPSISMHLKPSSHIISIMAGISMPQLKSQLGPYPVARVMPNTPSFLGEGMSAITFDTLYHPPQKAFVRTFFESVGKVLEIPEDAHNIATAISGCGPAFVYALADAIAEEGAANGLTYSQALQLCAQTFIGAGHMLLDSGQIPEHLIKKVASPGGATEAGINTLATLNLNHQIKAVIHAAYARSIELGNPKENH